MIAFTAWPEELAQSYRQRGYWQDLPLSDILSRQLATPTQAQACAIVCGERQFSYAELARLSDNLAANLARLGLGHGDTALVQLPNQAEFYLVLFALFKLGVAAVYALPSHQRQELSAYAGQIQPRLVIASAQHALFEQEEFTQHLRRLCPTLETVVISGQNSYALNLAELFQASGESTPAYAPVAADQVAFFQLSGGSTGTPKLIPRTHNDYYYSVRRSAEICQLNRQTRFLCALPAAHNYTLSSPGGLGVLYAGGCIVLAANPAAELCFDLIKTQQVSMVALVPSAVMMWLHAASLAKPDLPTLRLIQVGGASFAESLARQVLAVFNCQLQQVFGMAEGLVNYTRLDDDLTTICCTQGKPMSDADEVEVRDADGRLVGVGQTGLLHTRGPYTFRGYFQAPEQNARVFDERGFYCSGDLVQQDARGYLKVVGRVKDQINRGGEKIAAEEIENLLLRHPAVLQAALVALPDPLLGEKSCAVVVLKQSIKSSVLRRYLREAGIAEFKLPDRFVEMSDLPLTAVGKTDKPALRQRLQQLSPVLTTSV